ncbi:MAG: hypothetical protein ACJ72K_04350 [Friedmanniella sp.]|jgi:hypothetical protein
MTRYQHITIEDNGRLLAEARVRTTRQMVHAALRVEPGQLPPGTRTRLVDALLDLSTAQPGTRMHVTMPAGDVEILGRMRERCTSTMSWARGTKDHLEATTPQR